MKESSEQFAERMKVEGRWDDFNRRRAELRAGGTNPALAYRLAVKEFGGKRDVEVPRYQAKRAVSGLDKLAAVDWVYSVLGTSEAVRSRAPDIGAWNLLQQAIRDPEWFWDLWKGTLPQREKRDSDTASAVTASDRRVEELIRKNLGG